MTSSDRIRRPLVLVTGAGGFVGAAVRGALMRRGSAVRLALRAVRDVAGAGAADTVETGKIESFAGWPTVLQDVGCVVHLANVAHVGRRGVAYARAVNVEASARLVEAAAGAGVARFVYVSSAKVHGEETLGVPFDERSALAPRDPYAKLKVEAEGRLGEIAARSGLDLVIVRPPLVYGPGAKANVLALLRSVAHGLPLPFSSIKNRRSLIYVGNLADAIVRCVDSPAAAGKAYLVSDETPVSTPELCKALGDALGRPARLFPFPAALLDLAPPLRKLTRSLELDDSAIRRELGWTSPYTFEQGIRATAEWYLRAAREAHG
jgi:nucleoside-diphosphate-sugar epimerase